MRDTLKIAVQKSGRLTEKSLGLMQQAGIEVSNGGRVLKTSASNFPLELLFLRDDDIPEYVMNGVADAGIVGSNVVAESGLPLELALNLGFARCRMSIAVPKSEEFSGPKDLEGKRIATSYPKILGAYLNENGVNAQLETISGSVELAPGIGLADAVFDIVSSGSTLFVNGLKEVVTVTECQAQLVANPSLSTAQQNILDDLVFRFQSVQRAQQYKYILLNAPDEQLDTICALIPGMKSPTVLPLRDEGWSSVHSVVRENEFWKVIDSLRTAGAEGILVTDVEKMIL